MKYVTQGFGTDKEIAAIGRDIAAESASISEALEEVERTYGGCQCGWCGKCAIRTMLLEGGAFLA
jgi:ribosomal protein L34E